MLDYNNIKIANAVSDREVAIGWVIINGSLYSKDRQAVCGEGHDCSAPKGWREIMRESEIASSMDLAVGVLMHTFDSSSQEAEAGRFI